MGPAADFLRTNVGIMTHSNVNLHRASAFGIVAIAIGVVAGALLAADGAFYRQFEAIAANASSGPLASPLLVEIDNTLPKITEAVLSLDKLRRTGQVGGVNVQMTMDQVVERWGKPPEFIITSSGEPFLRYQDADISFWPGTNRMITMSFDARNKRFENGLSSRSTTNAFVSFLGKPSKVVDMKGTFLLLIYDTPQVRMYLNFHLGETNELWRIELDRPPGRTMPRHE